jgi:hypothetical protein
MRCRLVMIPSVDHTDAPPGERAEAGDAPPTEAVARTMRFNEELVQAGALIALDRLHARARGTGVAGGGGKSTVTDGPCTEAKDVLGSDWMIQANSVESVWLLVGSALYLFGCMLVIIVCNVPLNNARAATRPGSAEGADLWACYLRVWTRWNHLRTTASLAAMAAFVVALRQGMQ